jgi:hypothetical protein
MDVVFNRTQMQFEADFANAKRLDATIKDYQQVTVYKDADPYTGSYEVTPKVEAQTMPTAQKLMAQDVTIKAIPIYNVSNNSGGSTVYIAKEV